MTGCYKVHINFRNHLGKGEKSAKPNAENTHEVAPKPAADVLAFPPPSSRPRKVSEVYETQIPRPSSKQDNYPTGSQAMPLVWKLKKIGVFHQVWSCEGQEDLMGNLWIIPRVWFYSDSDVHILALAKIVENLFSVGKISTQWGVSVTYSDGENPETTFSLEPQPKHTEGILDSLRHDMNIISEQIESVYMKICGEIEDSGN
jgi:hypothetical protein